MGYKEINLSSSSILVILKGREGVRRWGIICTSLFFSNYTRRHIMEILTGDIVRLKKKHPCGSFDWEVLRSGADFRLKCCGCEHQVMMARKLVEKNIRRLERNGEEMKITR